MSHLQNYGHHQAALVFKVDDIEVRLQAQQTTLFRLQILQVLLEFFLFVVRDGQIIVAVVEVFQLRKLFDTFRQRLVSFL